MKKRLFVATLALLLLSTGTLSGTSYGVENTPNEKIYQQTFSDVPTNHWAFSPIADLVERGAIKGYPDGLFRPTTVVTRQEFAKIMVVAAGLTATPVAASSYADVPLSHWVSPFAETAKPYITAYQHENQLLFKPTEGALREDIAVAVIKLHGYDARLADLSLLNVMFSDVDSISQAARPYVALAVENKIISGYTDGTFRAQSTITRSEAAAILWRAFQYGSDEKVITGATTLPSPPATPTPTASPVPTETPAEKEWAVTTLGKASSAQESPVAAPDGSAYYISGNKVYKAAGGTTTEIMDGSMVSCQTPNSRYGDYTSWILGDGSDAGEILRFEGLTLCGLTYDAETGKMLALGYNTAPVGDYAVSRSEHFTSIGGAALIALYDLALQDKPISVRLLFLDNDPSFVPNMQKLSEYPARGYSVLAMGGNTYAYFGANPQGNKVPRIYLLDGDSSNSYVERPIEAWNGIGLTNGAYSMFELCKSYQGDGNWYTHDLASGKMTASQIKGLPKVEAGKLSDGEITDDTIYFAYNKEIYRIPHRTLVTEKYIPTTALDIKDGKPMGQIGWVQVVDENTIVFYDQSNDLFRRMTKSR